MVGSGLTEGKTGLLMPPPRRPEPPMRPREVGSVTELRGLVPARLSPAVVEVWPPNRLREAREVRPSPEEPWGGKLRAGSRWARLWSTKLRGLLASGLCPSGFTMGLQRSRAVTVVVVAPPSPPISDEGVKPGIPKEEKASLVLREATPEEDEVEEDSPAGRHTALSTPQGSHPPSAALDQGLCIPGKSTQLGPRPT